MKRIIIFTLPPLSPLGLAPCIRYINTHVDLAVHASQNRKYIKWENGLNWTVIFSFLPMKVQKAML